MDNYLNLAPCLYFSSADDGTIIEVNDTLCNKLGYERAELTGARLEILFTVATRIFQQTHFFPLLKMNGHAEEIFITLVTKQKNEVPVLINAERKLVDGNAVYIHVGIIVQNRKKFEDEIIAARKAAEAALHENTALVKAKEELQQHTEKLDHQVYVVEKQNRELRQFNRVVTHDLQEPLRKLSIFTNLLRTQEGKEEKKTLDKLASVYENMRSIVSGLQQYVWLTESSMQPSQVNLDRVLLQCRQKLEAEFPDAALEVASEGLEPVEGDEEQVTLLFYHLLSNVIRFRKPGQAARARITGSSVSRNQFRNMKDKYKYSDYLKVRVADEGIGFDSVFRDQAFELFKRLHAESGRGIGLSLAKKIMDNHNGEISIDSRKGEGSTVTLLLPIHQPGARE